MKKTFLLTALLGLWGVLSSAKAFDTLFSTDTLCVTDVTILDGSTTSCDFGEDQSSVYTIALLNLDKLKGLAKSTSQNAMLISYEQGNNHYGIGRANDNSRNYPLRFFNLDISATPPTGEMKGYYLDYGATGNTDHYTLNELDFTNVVGATLAMGMKVSSATASCLTLMYADGTFVDYAYDAPGYITSSEYSGVAVSSTYVDKAYVYKGEYSKEILQTASHGILQSLVPEPTTATLSLLALVVSGGRGEEGCGRGEEF